MKNCKEVENLFQFYLRFCFTIFYIPNSETMQYFLSGQDNVESIELVTNMLLISMRDGYWFAEIYDD